MDISKNVGTADKTIRVIIAVSLIALLVTHTISSGKGVLIGWIFVAILLISAIDETCPLYLLLGLNTRRKRDQVS